MHMSAIEDAATLVPWAEPNEVALNDEKTSEAVLRALSGPLPAECAMGVPLLRFATEDVPAMPLLEALLEDPLPRHDSRSCDRCGESELSVNDRLWIPSGASVVVVAMCWSCRARVFGVSNNSLVWS